MANGMSIVWREVNTLVPYAKNAKLHDEKQIENVANSIRRFGWKQPLVVDRDGVVVIGHCRLAAAKKLGLKTVPCVVADDLSEEDVRELRIADNKTNESPWDYEALEAEIEDLSFEGFEFDFGGFDVSEDGDEEAEITEDDFDEDTAPVTSKCIPGGVYQLGRHRLMCGSSANADDMAVLMAGEKADMVFTDPPYGVAIGDKNETLNSIQNARRCTTNISGDTMSEDELYAMLKAAMINVRENCKDDASYYVTSPQGGSLGLMMMMMMKDAGLEVRHVLMWVKNSATFSLGRLDYDYKHEPMFYTWTKSHHNYRKGKFRNTTWEIDKPRKCDLHPTMKPVELVANAMLDGTQEDDIVLDAFGGSGTTMIAAEQLGRCARLMEIDPHYCDVIIARWEQLTGEKAERVV